MIEITFASITAFAITFLAIPPIIKVALIKHLYDQPDERKVHTTIIPRLGGVAIFAGCVFALTFWTAGLNYKPLQTIIAALLIIFFIGLKDDLVTLTPSKKFIGQLLAACIIVFIGDIRITSLCGIFGIYALPSFASYLFSVFTIIGITNSFNLMDGIDGLAGGVGAIAAFTFGLWFYNYDQVELCVISFSLFGALLGFLVHNFYPAKIFMGDTGSLISGMLLSILAINFIQLSFYATPNSFQFRSSPAMAISILIIPLFDTIRIFIWRLYKKRSPFQADRNHMHHILLDIGMSQRQAAFSLFFVNLLFIFTALALRNISSLVLLIVIIVMAIALSIIPITIRNWQRSKAINTKTAL
jgi:UDP-N-acetylmuramyl pentapeptide phosphotransferase/UDP-N-acetylglucosamine-1-phosphate transferase